MTQWKCTVSSIMWWTLNECWGYKHWDTGILNILSICMVYSRFKNLSRISSKAFPVAGPHSHWS